MVRQGIMSIRRRKGEPRQTLILLAVLVGIITAFFCLRCSKPSKTRLGAMLSEAASVDLGSLIRVMNQTEFDAEVHLRNRSLTAAMLFYPGFSGLPSGVHSDCGEGYVGRTPELRGLSSLFQGDPVDLAKPSRRPFVRFIESSNSTRYLPRFMRPWFLSRVLPAVIQTRLSIIREEDISEIEVHYEGGEASGLVSLEGTGVFGVFLGKIPFHLRREHLCWKVTAFDLPAMGWHFIREKSGNWRWSDSAEEEFGRLENPENALRGPYRVIHLKPGHSPSTEGLMKSENLKIYLADPKSTWAEVWSALKLQKVEAEGIRHPIMLAMKGDRKWSEARGWSSPVYLAAETLRWLRQILGRGHCLFLCSSRQSASSGPEMGLPLSSDEERNQFLKAVYSSYENQCLTVLPSSATPFEQIDRVLQEAGDVGFSLVFLAATPYQGIVLERVPQTGIGTGQGGAR